MKATGADVVAERPPRFRGVVRGRCRECLERRVFAEPLVIFRQDAVDLRLLKHHLGHEDVVRVGRAAPWKIASVLPVPPEQSAPEALTGERQRQGGGGHPPL